jgi:hypothetical protein
MSAHTKIIEVEESSSRPVELSISAEKVCFIIVKAREFDAKEAPHADNVSGDDPGSNPSDSGESEILEDFPDDPTESELRDAITGLNEDEQIDLIAMMWIGRGDYTKIEWNVARSLARQERNDAARYLVGTPELGDFLEEGMAALGYSCEEFEMNRL